MKTANKLVIAGIFLSMVCISAYAGLTPAKVEAVNEASITINVTYFANLTSTTPLHTSNMSSSVYVGSSSTPFGTGSVTIPLTLNGTTIVDPDSTDNVPGLHVTRKNGYVEIAAYGYNDVNSREYVKANFNLSNASITSLQNDPTDTYETFSNGLCSIVEGNNTLTNDDEYTLSGNSGTLCSITNTNSDNIKIFYSVTPSTPSVTIKANGQPGTITINPGQPVTLSWESSGVGYCNTGTSIAPWGPYINKATSGSEIVYPTTNITYGIQCSLNSGTNMIVQSNVGVSINQANCVASNQQRCVGNNLYWFDSCGSQGNFIQYCANGCVNNACQTNICTQSAYQRCNGNNLYWYDSCGNVGSLIQYCANGCVNNACQNATYGNCTYHAYKLCQGNNIYWYSSCGEQQDFYATCSGGQICKYGQCTTYVAPVPTYVAHYRTACFNNSIYWYDSIGAVNSLYKTCSDNNSCTIDTCTDSRCVNTLKCDGSSCANNSTDYNTYCKTATDNKCGNGLCEATLGETTTNCSSDCKTAPVTLSLSFFNRSSDTGQWQKSTEVGPNGKIYFEIAATNTSATQIDNVNVSANIPTEITSLGNLKVDGVALAGDIVSGVNVGSISSNATKLVTFEGRTQSISTAATKQATATTNISGTTQSDSVSISLSPTKTGGAAVSGATSTSGFVSFLKRWYVWILLALVVIFLFVVVFRRLSSQT